DIVIISKTDLIESDEIDAIYEITAKINPSAKVIPSVKGNVSPKVIAEIGPYKNEEHNYDKTVTSWMNIKSSNLASPFRPATVSGAVGVSKPKIVAHSDIDSFCLELDEPIEPMALMSAVSAVQEQYGDSILRIKGILDLKGQDKPIVIHGVLGNLYPLSELKGWPDGMKKTQLVFICRASVLEQIKHMLNEILINPDPSEIAYYQSMIDNIERYED
ncbi:MAG: GTP-binding protein, partial [Succinivibrio sp.]